MQLFDSGYLFGAPSGLADATPVRFGSLQGIQADLIYKLNRVALPLQASAVDLIGALDLKFTAKVANINGRMFNQLFMGQAMSSGSQLVSRDEAFTVPSARPPYNVVPVPPNGGAFLSDLGVQYSLTGVVFDQVASAPAAGQYSLSSGTYTFNVADAGVAVSINYLYSSTIGNSLVLANGYQGIAPYFSVVLNNLYDGKQMTWSLNRCASQQLRVLLGVEKMSIPEFTFHALGDSAGAQGTIGTFSYSE